MRYGATVLCVLLSAGCAQTMQRPATADGSAYIEPTATSPGKLDPLPVAAAERSPQSLPEGIYPASQDALPTTAGEIFLNNLDSRIDVLIEAGAEQPGSPAVAVLAGMLYHRFQILGRISDAERALALIENVEHPSAAELRLRSSLRSGLHHFDQALADLDRAASMDRPRASDQRARRAIAFAIGDYAHIDDVIAAADQPSHEFGELVFRGNMAAYKGDLANASLQFFRAQQTVHNTDPYALAWLYAQQGITLLRFGECERALPFFHAAEARIPGYALAMDHRAECLLRLDRLDAARELYEKLYTQTGNPIFLSGQALVAMHAGNHNKAEELEQQADAAWSRLLERQPLAWSEHAAEYYLAIGQEQEALRLAEVNLANRRDVRSLILMARAAHANGDRSRACRALSAVRATVLQPPELQWYAADLPNCSASIAGTTEM